MPKGWELLWALHIQGSQNTAHPRVQEGNWLFSLTITCTQWSWCWVTSQSKRALCCPPKAVRTAQGTLGMWAVHCLPRSTCYYIHWIKQCTSETSPQHSFSGFLFHGDNGHYPHENKTLPFSQAPTWLSIYRKHCSFQNMLIVSREVLLSTKGMHCWCTYCTVLYSPSHREETWYNTADI